jgi:hypothetical protein
LFVIVFSPTVWSQSTHQVSEKSVDPAFDVATIRPSNPNVLRFAMFDPPSKMQKARLDRRAFAISEMGA